MSERQQAKAILASLVRGDFNELTDAFEQAGFKLHLPTPGILTIHAAPESPPRRRLLLSVGIHGDETAPIEIMAQILAQLAAEPQRLRVDLMLVVGNLAAIENGKRYLEADLNRQFELDHLPATDNAEARRAQAIMRATREFFSAPEGQRWHLDLHTAIRSSLYPSFAIVPTQVEGAARQLLFDWLAAAGTGAAVLSPNSSGTYSAYTAINFNAVSCTAELGRVAPLGENNLAPFAAAQAALLALLTGSATVPGAPPLLFAVAQELVKRSEDFNLAFAGSVGNFTAMPQGALIAQEGGQDYRVAAGTEYVLFPNAGVAIGQRAALMVVRCL